MIFLSLDHVLALHQSQIDLYGGSHGLRDQNLLEASLEMPKQGFGGEYFHSFPFGMAAAYLFHIAKNHPFVDGNKRTALHTCLTFLEVNGLQCTLMADELVEFMVEVATGKHSKEDIAQILEKNCCKI